MSRHPQVPRSPVLGIDIGGVMVDRVGEDSDTSFFGSDPMSTPPVPGVREAVAELCSLFAWRVLIVSKAGPKISALSREWLARQGLVGEQGISPDNVHFVRKREDKASICQRYGITHVVDDRLDVLGHLTMVEHRYLFTGGLGRHAAPELPPNTSIELVPDWPTLVTIIRRTLQPSDTTGGKVPRRR